MSDPPSMNENGDLAAAGSGMGAPNGRKSVSLKIGSEKTSNLAQLNERLSEWCSSILVKETRQALKSRQFIWTYFVLILFVATWTVLGLSFGRLGYDSGRQLLVGYWVILGFPLGLIIPFTAYRSLASEYEDGTIHLISITTMKPYQIVIGKFGSAALQMLIYLSILAPCIMLTYLLRGISFQVIVIGLAASLGGSVALTILGLFLAGAFRSRTLGVGVSVLFVLLLGWVYFLWTVGMTQFMYFGNVDWSDPDAATSIYASISFLVSTSGLLLVTAVSQISFASNNRSTWIRVMMIVQQTLFLGWVIASLTSALTFGMAGYELTMLFAAHYWLAMGFLMNGESSRLSRRVQRSLPRSLFARSFFSLMMPGAGRGFLFAVANIWSMVVSIGLVGIFARYLVDTELVARNQLGFGITPGTGIVTTSYDYLWSLFGIAVFATWFLAVNYLVMRWIFKRANREWGAGTGPLLSFLMGAFLVAFVSIGSAILHARMSNYGWSNFTWPLIYNWYAMSDQLNFSDESRFTTWLFAFGVPASVVIFLAVFVASKELLCRPIAVPERVAIDLENIKPRSIPAGESISEIFGELNSEGDA